jgi:ATP-binding cassette subfamily G (WHITE) protein 2 (SNQ2)
VLIESLIGAGKTTLLDTISQRKTTGKVEGEFLIDGQPLDAAFGRRTGFVQQGDIHEPFSTLAFFFLLIS